MLRCSGLRKVDRSRGQKSISCGRKFAEKSAAYVSAARVVSKPKFIAHFFCKASLAIKINIAECYSFC